MPLPAYTVDDFTAAFQGLQPTGAVWPRDADEVNTQVVQALMPSAVRSWESTTGLITDSFPPTAVQLLPDWELSLGLPDPCAPIDTTTSARQAHVVARLTQSYGPSVAGLTAYAAALGYTITITPMARARFGKPLFGGTFAGDAWSFVWQVNAVGFVITPLEFGGAAFGKPFSTWTSSVLVCELSRIRPAHTIVMFESGSTLIAQNPTISLGAGVVAPYSAPTVAGGGVVSISSGVIT